MWRCTGVVTVFLCVIVPYSFNPVLIPFLHIMCYSILAVFIFKFHCFKLHWVHTSTLIFLIHADLKALYLNGYLRRISSLILLIFPLRQGNRVASIVSSILQVLGKYFSRLGAGGLHWQCMKIRDSPY